MNKPGSNDRRQRLRHESLPAPLPGPLSPSANQAEAHWADPAASPLPAGLLITRLGGKMAQVVQKSDHDEPVRGHGLTALVLVAVDLADYSYAEISVHPAREAPALIRAVDRIIDGAQRYFEADSPLTERAAAMACVRALELYGWVLRNQYGNSAQLARTQLRILRNRMLASIMGPSSWN